MAINPSLMNINNLIEIARNDNINVGNFNYDIVEQNSINYDI